MERESKPKKRGPTRAQLINGHLVVHEPHPRAGVYYTKIRDVRTNNTVVLSTREKKSIVRARVVAAELARELDAPPPPEVTATADALERWLQRKERDGLRPETLRGYRYEIRGPKKPPKKPRTRKTLTEALPARLDGITYSALETLFSAGAGSQIGRRNAQRWRTIILEALEWARKHRWVSREQVLDARDYELPRLRSEDKSPEPPAFEWAEVERLLAGSEGRLRLGILLQSFTGMRRNTARLLRWEHVQADRLDVTGDVMKTGRRWVCPIHPRLRAALEAVPRGADGEKVLDGHRLEDSSLKCLMRKVGVERRPGLSWHSFRRRFITSIEESGATPGTIRTLAAHRGSEITDTYIRSEWSRLQEAIATLPGARAERLDPHAAS